MHTASAAHGGAQRPENVARSRKKKEKKPHALRE